MPERKINSEPEKPVIYLRAVRAGRLSISLREEDRADESNIDFLLSCTTDARDASMAVFTSIRDECRLSPCDIRSVPRVFACQDKLKYLRPIVNGDG